MQMPVHPHTCGVYHDEICLQLHQSGSSPHMWGLPDQAGDIPVTGRFIPTHVGFTCASQFPELIFDRFIPTHVGFTCPASRACVRLPVHPHACGVYRYIGDEFQDYCGSSPRMWGLLNDDLGQSLQPRFIPTHVGFTFLLLLSASIFSGSSPRMWGLRRLAAGMLP